MIKEISYEATYPIRHKVMWPNKPVDYIKLENDKSGKHFGFYKDEVLVSVISLFIDDQVGQFRKFATALDHQSKGYGGMLLKFVLKYCINHNINTLWCNARTDKTGYYKKFGFVCTEETFVKSNQSYVIMSLNLKKDA